MRFMLLQKLLKILFTMTQQGFVCGSATGMLYLYEKTDDVSYYRKKFETVVSAQNVGVKCISVNPAETSVAVVLENNEIHVYNLNSAIAKLTKVIFFVQKPRLLLGSMFRISLSHLPWSSHYWPRCMPKKTVSCHLL